MVCVGVRLCSHPSWRAFLNGYQNVYSQISRQARCESLRDASRFRARRMALLLWTRHFSAVRVAHVRTDRLLVAREHRLRTGGQR